MNAAPNVDELLEFVRYFNKPLSLENLELDSEDVFRLGST